MFSSGLLSGLNLPPTYHTSVVPLAHPEVKSRWESLLSSSPQASPFATLSYAEALTTHAGIEANCWFVADEHTDLAGLLVFSRHQGPFKRVVVPGFTPYSSLLFTQAATSPEEPFMLLLNSLAETFDDLRLHLHPRIEDVRPLSWVGWQTTPYFTFLFDLTAYDLAKTSWSTSTRRNFRKSVDDYTIEEDARHIGPCIALCADGYARSKRPFPIHPETLKRMALDLDHQNMIRTFVVLPRGKEAPEAGIVVLHDQRTACYWIAGSEPGPAMTVLLGHVLGELKNAGIQTFDFIGANTPSIAEFKRRFGPALTPYYAGLTTPNKALGALLQLKNLFSR